MRHSCNGNVAANQLNINDIQLLEFNSVNLDNELEWAEFFGANQN